ncbi:MAG: putative hydrogenase 4, component [Myxococcaceae bacterium]|nr:putative hydrogenase 4, component [Myxococcaceae bacterium]
MTILAHLAALLLLPIVLVGIINRTRARWSGRKGPPILQGGFDLWRLLKKRPVYSEVTTGIFRLAPLVVLATTFVSGLLVPLVGRAAPLSFALDFVALAYLWALGRALMILAALDTGSPFEGMGASREATWAALAEPGLFLALGTLAAASGHSSFAELLPVQAVTPAAIVVRVGCALTLFLILQLEAARVPIDDPSTHLELTMIHEVMILDHSGPDLAALQYATGLKLTIGAGLIAALLNPLGPGEPAIWVAAVSLGLTFAVAIAIGCVEALTARLQLKAVPTYLVLGSLVGLLALLTAAFDFGARR